MNHYCILVGAILGLSAVLAGAGGAHLLEDLLDQKSLSTFQTAVRFQMYHAIVLLFLGLLHSKKQSMSLTVAFVCFIFGVGLFCGSLYALALTGIGILGAIAPIGGIGLILGWACLLSEAITIGRNRRSSI